MKSKKSMDLPKDLPGNPWIYPQKCGFQTDEKDLRYYLDVIIEIKCLWEHNDCHSLEKETINPIQFYN